MHAYGRHHIFYCICVAHTRRHAPPPAVPLDLCVILHDSPKKKKRTGKKMKIRCDFWPLPGSSATLIAGNKAWHTTWNTDKHVVMPHTHTLAHTRRQRQSRNGAISMHISPDRDLRHTFISQTHSSCQATRSRLYLSLCLSCYSLSPSFTRSHFHFCPAKVSTTYAILRKMQSMED